jgi:hypothetical protein
VPRGAEAAGKDREAVTRVIYAYLETRILTSLDVDDIKLTLGPAFLIEAECMTSIVHYRPGCHFAAEYRGLHWLEYVKYLIGKKVMSSSPMLS